ncbi:hypothetical protein ACFL5H_00655, partial [Candidatus Latescibacterota bacterium]
DMSMRFKKRFLFSLVLLLPFLVVVTGFLTPPEIRYSSLLIPVPPEGDPDYSFDDETQAIIFDIGGSSIEVRSMNEEELNMLFPEESNDEIYSTNPYTYGDWIDPDLGYTPVRFTTFEVVLLNRTFSRMKIDPVEAILLTDQGESFRSYTFSVAAAKYGNSFEDYFRTRRGMSGNEFYRYEMRLGMVRGKNYGLDEIIFRGDSYSGLVTFDPLRNDVQRCQLQLNDIIYRFDAFNRPVDVTDAYFNFNRVVEREVITEEQRAALMNRERVRIDTSGNKQLVNNRVNDNDRSEYAVDRAIESVLPQMETCFIDRYRRDEVDPGNMVVSFTVAVNGTISSQNVIEVEGINSEDFMNCILSVIRNMKFEPIEDMPLVGTSIVRGSAEPVNVLYPIDFMVYLAD